MWNATLRPNFTFTLFQDLNFFLAYFYESIFRFLKKFEQVFVVLFSFHFPYTHPIIEIVSCNFKLSNYIWVNWVWKPLFILDWSVKHFKNISRKSCSRHCFLYNPHISSIENQFETNYYYTHCGAVSLHTWAGGRSGTIIRTSGGEQSEPSGVSELLSQNPPCPCVSFGSLKSNFAGSANSSPWITLCWYCSENSWTVTPELTSSDVPIQFTHVIGFRGMFEYSTSFSSNCESNSHSQGRLVVI